MPEHRPNPALACERNAVCSVIVAARVEEGKALRNTVVAFRTLRIRVLDIRSFDPVTSEPVESVWLGNADGGDKAELARYLATDRDWDVSKYRPLVKSGSGWTEYAPKGTPISRTLTYASQLALNALGFDTGRPANSYGPQGRTGYLKYRLAHGELEMKPEDLAKTKLLDVDRLADEFIVVQDGARTLKGMTDVAGNAIAVDAPDEAACEQIVQGYDTLCYRAAQFHLAALGFYPTGSDPLNDLAFDEKEGGDWTAAWIDAYRRYKLRYGHDGNVDWVHTEAIGQHLRDASKAFVTNQAGDLTIPIPLKLMRDGFSVELRFRDFPLVPEATLAEVAANAEQGIHRPFDTDALPDEHRLGTILRFMPRIFWKGPQSTARLGRFGWWIEHRDHAGALRRRELQRSVEFRFPALTADAADNPTWSAVQQQHKALSVFYQPPGPPELVVLAMRWCTPVWDEFADPLVPSGTTVPTVTDDVYCWPGSTEVGLHQHFVTRPDDGAGYDAFGGKGYGLFEHPSGGTTRWRGGNGHHGLDIHSQMDDPQFAVHGGALSYKTNSSGFGHRVGLKWGDDSVWYGHVSDKVGAAPRDVCAGEIIAKTGREGNIGANSRNPTHLHIQYAGSKPTNRLRSLPDAANAPCIPDNERTPLLFPCRCHTTSNADELKDCGFKVTSIASGCWAVAELACPHIPRVVTAAQLEGGDAAAALARRRVQAQLRMLGHYSAVTPDHPLSAAQLKALDGDFGEYADAGFATVKTAPKANMRSDPSLPKDRNANRIWQAPQGTRMRLLQTQGSWHRLEIPEADREAVGQDSGWMYKTTLTVGTLGTTREAILQFKTDRGLLPDKPTNEQKYSIDQPTLDRLDAEAGIIPLSAPET